MIRFVAFAAMLAIAGCVLPDPAHDVDFDDPDACGASAVQAFVGMPLVEAAGLSAPDGVRRIGPNDIVTTDLRPQRMNIEHDGTIVTRISCG